MIATGESAVSQVHLHSNRDGTLKDIDSLTDVVYTNLGFIPVIRLYDSQSIPTAGLPTGRLDSDMGQNLIDDTAMLDASPPLKFVDNAVIPSNFHA